MISPIASPLSATQLIDEYFIENRNRVLEVAAFLDRIDRADLAVADDDFRMRAVREAILALASSSQDRLLQIQLIFSDPRTEPLPELDRKGAVGAFDRRSIGVRS